MTRTILDNVRPTLHGMTPYVPGKPISEVQKEFGLTDIVKLASNENPLGPSPFALKAIQQALPELHRYPDGNSQILKEVLAAVHQVDMQAVLVGNGSDEVIKLVAETFLEPGDEVVMPTPSFSENWFAAQLMAAKPVPVPLNEDFSYDLEAVLAAVTARTKLVFLCTPNNPTGTYIREPELAAFLERLPGHVLVMLDEAYHEYVEANDAADGISLLKQGYPVAVMRTFSKLYGLAGLRVGYVVARPDILEFVNRAREPFNVNALAQVAAVAALSDLEHVTRSRQMNHAGKEQLYRGFEALGLPYIPTEANFILVHVGRDSNEMFREMLKRGVIVRSGAYFDLNGYLRVSIGTRTENQRFLDVLDAVLAVTNKPAGS